MNGCRRLLELPASTLLWSSLHTLSPSYLVLPYCPVGALKVSFPLDYRNIADDFVVTLSNKHIPIKCAILIFSNSMITSRSVIPRPRCIDSI